MRWDGKLFDKWEGKLWERSSTILPYLRVKMILSPCWWLLEEGEEGGDDEMEDDGDMVDGNEIILLKPTFLPTYDGRW